MNIKPRQTSVCREHGDNGSIQYQVTDGVLAPYCKFCKKETIIRWRVGSRSGQPLYADI
jgi:hypothetical protein